MRQNAEIRVIDQLSCDLFTLLSFQSISLAQHELSVHAWPSIVFPLKRVHYIDRIHKIRLNVSLPNVMANNGIDRRRSAKIEKLSNPPEQYP
uniref:Uncharacterized protein n=1 Tax=Steinernema glaseri TaxID=37863 RepID=A0A1I7YW74_9BILA